jgi:hypothetical protein
MLHEALGGSGRPAGVLATHPCRGGLVVEWDPEVTPVRLIAGLIDVELARVHSGRVTELLSPLAASTAAMIAASGLQAPQIEPYRILEERIERG